MTTINNSQNLIEKVGGIERAIALEAMLQKHAVPEGWKINIINGMWHRSSVGFTHSDLRTAIVKHDLKQCQHGYDIACLICGFGNENGVRVWRKQIESDEVTDIRNHVSPSTRVVDL